jgi:hypothetical protein
MIYILAAIYIVICIPVAFVGSGTRLGFLGTFIFSLLLTPSIMLFLLIMLMPGKRHRARSS